MSDQHAWNGGDPFTPNVIDDAIDASLRPGAPASRTATLVRTLDDLYALPPAADAVLARGRATLARRAAALESGQSAAGRPRLVSSDLSSSWPTVAPSATQPQRPPRRRVSPLEAVLRTAAAVIVIGLLGAGFFALLRQTQRLGAHPTPTATRAPTSPTATPGMPSPTAIPAQPPAPAGAYITAPGMVFRLNPSTGAVQRRYPYTAASNSSSQTYIASPVVANGAVYFTYRDTASPFDSGVVALSATSGAALWHTTTAAQLTQLTLANGVLFGGTAGTGTGSDTFYALRASDGGILWTFQTATLRANAVVTGGVVYLADQPQDPTHQHVHALRASDGSPLWDDPLPQACGIMASVAVDRGMVFASCAINVQTGQGGNGTVYALRASDGHMVWQVTANGQPYALAAGAGLVYSELGGKNASGARVESLTALDESSGAVSWQVANGYGPEFDGTTVYAQGTSGSGITAPASTNLAAFSAAHGTLLWTFDESNQRIESVPVITGGVVYQILNQQVVAISAASGTVLWRSPSLGDESYTPNGVSVVTGG